MRCLEDPSQLRWTQGASATRVFYVDGTTDLVAALGAVGMDFMPRKGTPFPWDSALVADQPEVANEGPETWRVSVTYVRRGQEQDYQVSWEMDDRTECETVDVDADGNAILNSAGFRFGQFPTNEFTDDWLTATRWQNALDIAIIRTFRNTVNSDAILIRGYGQVPPLQARLVSIRPKGEWKPTTTTIMPVVYRFHIRTPSFASDSEQSGKVSPHDYRIMDRSFMGRYSDAGVVKDGHFMDGGNKEYVEEIRLDGWGSPLKPDFQQARVGKGRATAVAPTTQPKCIMERDKGDGAIFLRMKRCKRQPFNSLYLFQ